MATRAILQTLRTPSPVALAASAVLHAWTGDWVDAAAALKARDPAGSGLLRSEDVPERSKAFLFQFLYARVSVLFFLRTLGRTDLDLILENL